MGFIPAFACLAGIPALACSVGILLAAYSPAPCLAQRRADPPAQQSAAPARQAAAPQRQAALFARQAAHSLRTNRSSLERIGSEDGLSHNSVYAILQDRDGFMWIGTADGLNRYDGYDFRIYRSEPDDSTSLSNSVVRALLQDRTGDLWVGTEVGLQRMDRRMETFHAYSLPWSRPQKTPHTVNALYEDLRGTLWVGADDGLFRYDRRLDRFELSARAGIVRSIAEDPEGRIWALTFSQETTRSALLQIRSEGRAVPFALPVDTEELTAILIDRSGRFWFDASGPSVVDSLNRRLSAVTTVKAWAILQDSDGNVWFGGGNGLSHVNPETRAVSTLRLDESDGGWLRNFVRALYQDRSGSLWIGTHGGLFRHDPHAKAFRHLGHDRTRPESLSADAVASVYADSSGVLWIGTFGGGLNRIDPSGRVTVYRHRPGDPTSLPNDVIWAVAPDHRGGLWLGVQHGLASFDPAAGRFRRHELRAPSGEPMRDFVGSIAADEAGMLWLATPRGLYAYDTVRGSARAYLHTGDEQGPSSDGIETVRFEAPGTLWIGTNRHVLDRLDIASGTFTHFPVLASGGAPLRSEGIWTIHGASDGSLWLGTGTGLSRFDPTTETFSHFHHRDGLPGSVVYSIREDADGRLWLGTNLGLVRFDPAAEPGRQFRTYESDDGTGNTEFNRRAAFAGPDGTFYFGGMNGLTIFKPDEIVDNPVVPSVVITRIQTADRHETVSVNPIHLDHLRLSYRDYSLAFEFAALNFQRPAKNRYAYRLEGFDSRWIDAGMNRIARYTNLPAGDYVFRVRGSNNDGVWNEQGAALRVSVAPPYWETIWFRVLVLAVVAGLLAAAYRYRVRRLLEVERLRLRIAGDLHDDFSSDLTGIALLTDVVRRHPGIDPDDQAALGTVRDTALHMVEALRDVVWAVNPKQDTIDSLVLRMRNTAALLLRNIDYRLDAPTRGSGGSDKKIDMLVRQNVFLIFKEALHNVVRHAEAQRVEIAFTHGGGRLSLRIRDDGTGFDPAADAPGNGRAGMQERAERLGAVLRLDSRPGAGTVLTLTLDYRES